MSSWLRNPTAKARIELIEFRSLSGTTARSSCPLSSKDAARFQILWCACVLFAVLKGMRQSRRRLQLTRGKLQSSHANRKIACFQMNERVSVIVVFLSKQVTYEFNVTVHSAGHDIFCKHRMLQESSCSNVLCLQNYFISSFWRNQCVCVWQIHVPFIAGWRL